MQIRKEDADVLKDGRKKTLQDSDELEVVVPLRDQVVKKLVKKLEDLGEGQRTTEIWRSGNSQRGDWLMRQEDLLRTFDEFIEPIYDSTADWSSTLHMPVVFTMCKTFHARFLAALFGVDPPFTVKARQAANVDRAFYVQEFMRYSLMTWANKYQGVEGVADIWLWKWITSGRGIIKSRWERSFTRFVDVVEEETQVGAIAMPSENGQLAAIPQMQKREVEKEVVIPVFDGPMIEYVATEDVLIVGNQDPQEADHVIHSSYMTASQLWSLVDQGIFREEAVEKIIAAGEDMLSKEPVNAQKEQQKASSGAGSLDTEIDEKRYQILERHSRIDVDGSGIASDVIMWVHGPSGEICKATYLYRVSKTGLRPFFAIDFHIRENGMPAGLPELLFSLAKEIDCLHNLRVDYGVLSSMPFGYYRATSSLSEERMPIEPGTLVPLDNPTQDVYFPNLGNRTSFAAQEEQMLMQSIERMTSISDLSLGIVGGQGAARTATGARALLGESSANLDVYLRRLSRGWKRMLLHLYEMLQERAPDGMQFRILGDDGNLQWETLRSRQELCGQFDFEIDANSANSNKQITIEQANTILTTIANPLFMQMGIVGAPQIYNGLKNLFMQYGVKDFSKYIAKPQGSMRQYTPEEIANLALSGVEVPLDPTQDLEGFLKYFEHIIKHDELLGQFSVEQTKRLAAKAMEAQQLMQAMQAQQAQVANQTQMMTNASMATPSAQGAGMAAAQPAAPMAATAE